MPAAPVSGSPGARQLAEESNTTAGGLADGERSASVEDGSAMIPEATAGSVRTSGAKARVADDAPESRSMEPVAPEELTAPLEAS